MSFLDALKKPFTKAPEVKHVSVHSHRQQLCEQDAIATLRSSVYAMALRGHDLMFAYKAYDAAAPIATAVDLIAESLADIMPTIFDKELEEFDKTHDVIKFLNNPGFGQDWRSFVVDAAISFLLTRNTYIKLVGRVNETPLAMENMKPFWVTHEINQNDGHVQRFDVNPPTVGSFAFNRTSLMDWRFLDNGTTGLNELVHIKGQTDELGKFGNSPITALMLTILQNVAGGQHNASLLSNGARPSGALSTDGELSEDQYQRLKEQIDKDYSGPNNAGRPLLLDGGLKWGEMSISNKDMDFIELLTLGKEDVFSRYKVPIGLVSPKAMTLDNYNTSVVTLYDLAVLPLLKAILSGLGRVLLPRFGVDTDRFMLTFNPASISASMIKTGQKVKLMSSVGAFTINELRNEFGAEPRDDGEDLVKANSNDPTNTNAETGEQEKSFMSLVKNMGMSQENAQSLWHNKT